MNEQKLLALWGQISVKQNLGLLGPIPGVTNWDQFKSKMSTPENRKKFWDAAHNIYQKAGIDLGSSSDEFEQTYGVPSDTFPIPLPTDVNWVQVTYEVYKDLKEAGKKVLQIGDKFYKEVKKTVSDLFPPIEQACPTPIPVPRASQVEDGTAALKECMQGPIIKRLQETPVFKEIYFKVLKDNGIMQPKTHEVFGPFMTDAVVKYQKMKNITPVNGVIGPKTYKSMIEDTPPAPVAPVTPVTPPKPEPPKPAEVQPFRAPTENDPEYLRQFFKKRKKEEENPNYLDQFSKNKNKEPKTDDENLTDYGFGRRFESIYKKENKRNMKTLIKDPIPQDEKSRILELHNILKLSELKKNKNILAEQGRQLNFEVPLEGSEAKTESLILDPSDQFDYMTKVLKLCKNQIGLFNNKDTNVQRHNRDANISFIQAFDENDTPYVFYAPNTQGTGSYKIGRNVNGKMEWSEPARWNCPAVKAQFDKQSPQTDVQGQIEDLKKQGWKEYQEWAALNVDRTQITTQFIKKPIGNTILFKPAYKSGYLNVDDKGMVVGGEAALTAEQQEFVNKWEKLGYLFNVSPSERYGKKPFRADQMDFNAKSLFPPEVIFYYDPTSVKQETRRGPNSLSQSIEGVRPSKQVCRDRVRQYYNAWKENVELDPATITKYKQLIQKCHFTFEGDWGALGIGGKDIQEKINFLSRQGQIDGKSIPRGSPYVLDLRRL